MSAQFRTLKVCKERTAKAKSLSLSLALSLSLSLVSVCLCAVSALYLQHYKYLPSPKRFTLPLSPFLLHRRETCRLEEEGQEDEVAWEGLSPNRSICLLVCPPNWLLAPAQFLHSLRPDAKHIHIHTTGQHTSTPQC